MLFYFTVYYSIVSRKWVTNLYVALSDMRGEEEMRCVGKIGSELCTR